MTNRLNGCRLDPAIRDRVLEALKTLTDALDQSAANHSLAEPAPAIVDLASDGVVDVVRTALLGQ